MLHRCGLILGGLLAATAAQAHVVCDIEADAGTGKIIVRQGDCTDRVTPASTFKIAISLMGYDSGFLKDAHTPVLPFRKGYPDWRPEWLQKTDPTSWIKYSVVWYSQQVTQALGEDRFRKYAVAFHYGNADMSGDPGKHNGLTRAWLNSSLKISPLEQIVFLENIVNRRLPVKPAAFEMTRDITTIQTLPDGWTLHGKTGAAAAYGWFVGWAEKGARHIVFARLIEDDKPDNVPAGFRARDALLKSLPARLAQVPQAP